MIPREFLRASHTSVGIRRYKVHPSHNTKRQHFCKKRDSIAEAHSFLLQSSVQPPTKTQRRPRLLAQQHRVVFVLDRVTCLYGEREALLFPNAFSRKHFHSYTAMNPEFVHRLEKRNGNTFPLSNLKGDGLIVLSHQGLGQKFRDGDMKKGEKVCASLSGQTGQNI